MQYITTRDIFQSLDDQLGCAGVEAATERYFAALEALEASEACPFDTLFFDAEDPRVLADMAITDLLG